MGIARFIHTHTNTNIYIYIYITDLYEQREAGVGWELQGSSDVQYSSGAVAYGILVAYILGA
jgi:hypothetical protein